jgi:ATPase subunit of ABC transporter with duplicated ATPase domains
MLTVSQLSKSFAGRALLSLQVNRGDRIGLVGPNGAGKSTLLALLLGDVSPDKGTIAIEKNATIGFLPQETRRCLCFEMHPLGRLNVKC